NIRSASGLGNGPTPVDADHALTGPSRRRFLKRTALVTAAAVPAALLAASPEAEAQAQSENNIRELSLNFRSIQKHENEHTAFLLNQLGTAAPQVQFVGLQQRNFRAFRDLAVLFENTGSRTYTGASPLIFSRDVLRMTAPIALVEGRHAGWLNTIVGQTTTGHIGDASFEQPLTPTETATAVAPFLAPPGPDLALALARAIEASDPSPENDTRILQFAFVLEALEAEFYNLNVPRIFRGRR
ncbi:MAG TPA: ferritin-like domain-containing protein, partial [Isosphaeraceae bacterium]